MTQVQLSSAESRVYAAVNALEARGETPYPSAIARETALPAEELNQTLHSLAEKNLLRREESPIDGTDLGPRWCVRQPA